MYITEDLKDVCMFTCKENSLKRQRKSTGVSGSSVKSLVIESVLIGETFKDVIAPSAVPD